MGFYHNSMIKTDGTLWAVGNGGNGQLGDGTTVSKSSPIQVGVLTTWATSSGGFFHVGAVKTDGTLWMMGDNGYGQLGDGTTVNRSSLVQIGSLTSWVNVGGGQRHSSMLSTDGTMWTCGKGAGGVLAQGADLANKSSPVQVGSLTTWNKTWSSADAPRTLAGKKPS